MSAYLMPIKLYETPIEVGLRPVSVGVSKGFYSHLMISYISKFA
jgi:hypothetical protein